MHTYWEHLVAVDLNTLLWLSAACALAYFLKGFSGFGPALVLVPTVSYLFDPKTALATSAFVDLFVGVGLLRFLPYDRADRRLVLRLASFVAVGSVAGAALAGIAPVSLLRIVIMAVVFCFGVSLIVFHRPVPVRITAKSTRALDIGCVVGGLSGGLVGMSGPFIVVFARPLMDKERFRRVLVALFLLEGIVKLAAYSVSGVWTPSTLPVSTLAMPAVLLGLVVGFRSHVKVDEKRFSIIVGLILVGLSARLLAA